MMEFTEEIKDSIREIGKTSEGRKFLWLLMDKMKHMFHDDLSDHKEYVLGRKMAGKLILQFLLEREQLELFSLIRTEGQARDNEMALQSEKSEEDEYKDFLNE